MSFPGGQSLAGEGISRIPGKTVFSNVKQEEAAQRPGTEWRIDKRCGLLLRQNDLLMFLSSLWAHWLLGYHDCLTHTRILSPADSDPCF